MCMVAGISTHLHKCCSCYQGASPLSFKACRSISMIFSDRCLQPIKTIVCNVVTCQLLPFSRQLLQVIDNKTIIFLQLFLNFQHIFVKSVHIIDNQLLTKPVTMATRTCIPGTSSVQELHDDNNVWYVCP